jgi:hypothetical protein
MTREMHTAAVRALLRIEAMARAIWDPACGHGRIVAARRSAGYRVYPSDLDSHGCPDADSGVNFMSEGLPPFRVGAVVTAPPLGFAGDIVSHALKIGVPAVAALLPLGSLTCARLAAVLDGGDLTRVYPLVSRPAPACRPSGHAWFVWRAGHCGRAEVQRITWEPVTCD